jgi:hypothetical protein
MLRSAVALAVPLLLISDSAPASAFLPSASRALVAGRIGTPARCSARSAGRQSVILGVSMEEGRVQQDIALETETVFDGGFLPDGGDQMMKDLLKDLEELSETEARLRREGAMMVLEKIRQGSARDDAPPPIPPSPPPDSNKMSVISRKLAGRNGPTVWGEFGALAAQTKGVNLGQGFPNWDPPQFVRDAAVEAIMEGSHQYTRSAGHPSLISLLAARYSMHLDRDVHPESEVAVTVGASQALFVALQALIEEGDEVVLMEPFFDLYLGQIHLAGGTPRFVPLEPTAEGAWALDVDKLRAAISPRTRVLILNSPHNPTGKVHLPRLPPSPC